MFFSGSPRRKPFQRQRVTTEITEEVDLPPSSAPNLSSGLQSLSAGLVPQPISTNTKPSATASLCRYLYVQFIPF